MSTEHTLQKLLRERILILDGAMGTMIQGHGLSEADFRGARFADHPADLKGCNDLLSLTRPDVIGAIHRAYLRAGADLIETNTFNATRVSMADYGLEAAVFDINVAAARVAKEAALRPRLSGAHDALGEHLARRERPGLSRGGLGRTGRGLR